ncbi:uncharacterized protein LOC143883083 [Tasmannia lanceolata]|uniref:uncharacterized protein LOC143883083 n=1 Tax=Tasmannia lanceolata TaxID=3420 RepID=UPI0040647530
MMIGDVPTLTTWTMYFDGESNSKGKGISIVLVSPRDEHILISIKLDFDYTNNVAEYEAFIAGLEAALSLEIHANLIHVPPSKLHSLTSPWSFSVWGIDIIGKVSPKSSSGHEYILVAIDYFTKWIEAQSYASISSASVAKFTRANIFCRYGVPHELISYNGSHFKKEVTSLCEEFRIKHHKSSPYRPQTNYTIEAAIKNTKTILQKMTRSYKDWSSKLSFALWAYRTSVRTSTGATPYSLTYGMEAILPIELKIPSLRILRILMKSDLPESE